MQISGVSTARELVRALNELRKDIGLDLTDRVAVTIDVVQAPRVAAAIDAHRPWIAGEVLATELATGSLSEEDTAEGRALDIDGEPVQVAIRRA